MSNVQRVGGILRWRWNNKKGNVIWKSVLCLEKVPALIGVECRKWDGEGISQSK